MGMITLATDVGPECMGCRGTIYSYEAQAPGTWRAECTGCKAADYFHTPMEWGNVARVRAWHEDAIKGRNDAVRIELAKRAAVRAAVKCLLADVIRTNGRIGRARVARLATTCGLDADQLESALGRELEALLGDAAANAVPPARVKPAAVVKADDVVVDVREYEANHGAKPRGRGRWTFTALVKRDDGSYAPTSTSWLIHDLYGAAATRARRVARKAGYSVVQLQP